MDEPLICIDNLSKIFNHGRAPAVQEISVTLPPKQMIGLIGPDGAGKTTLLRLIAGLLLPTQGEVTIQGKNTIGDAAWVHEMIGYMPQRFGLYEDLTVWQNLQLYADLRGVNGEEREKTLNNLLHLTSLEPFLTRLAGALSGGMKQKLGLACALVKKPLLLLLDEPTVGIDPYTRRELWDLVHTLIHEGISVIWSTTYLDEAARSDLLLLLQEGRLLYQGAPQALTLSQKKSFADAYIDLLGGWEAKESELAKLYPAPSSTPADPVVAKDLTKKFGSFTAVDKISFSVHRGEIFGLLGPNGAGKSTTFKMLCGLLKPTSGSAQVNGMNLLTAKAKAHFKIGYMAQTFSLYGILSVQQNLDFFSQIYSPEGSPSSAVKEASEAFGLTPYLSTSAEILPLGVKQRLSLASATIHHPDILFLDEPTSGVDPKMRREFWNHISSLAKKGVTVLVTTHFMEEAEYCDRIAIIHMGKLIELDTPNALKARATSTQNPHPSLEDAFIYLVNAHG